MASYFPYNQTMRINSTASGLQQAINQINARKTTNFTVPGNTRANMLSTVVENDIKVKLWDNRHGMTNFKYNIKEFINAQMNFSRRL